MEDLDAVVAHSEGDNERRFDEEPIEEAQPAEEDGQDPAGVTLTEPADVAEEPPLAEMLEDALTPGPELDEQPEIRVPRLMAGRRRPKRLLVKKKGSTAPYVKPEQRILILDVWRRSGLPAGDFADLVNVSKHTLYAWKKRFDEQGPAGLMDRPKGGPRGMRLPELTKRTILMLKETNPSWGCQRISDMLLRGPALPACPSTVGKVLKEAGYELHEEPTRPHPDKVRRFERAKSAFTKELEKRGIKQVVAHPRRPQTLGKVERFWGTLWRECIESSVFRDLGDAQTRIGLFMDYYNFQRVHSGIGGLVPADRFFGAAPEVLKTLKARVAANALELARNGTPKKPFYLTGQVGDKAFSVHAEGERVILTRQEGEREEIELNPGEPKPEEETPEPLPTPVSAQGIVSSDSDQAGNESPPAPGTSPLDEHFPVDAPSAEAHTEDQEGAQT